MIKSTFLLITIFLFNQNLQAAKQSKLDKDLQLNAGNYDLVDKNPDDQDCRPSSVELNGQGKDEFLYLGPRLLIGDVNQGDKKEKEFDGCKLKSNTKSSRENPDTGLIVVDALAKCPWGQYKENTQIRVKGSTIEYLFSRTSDNENEMPSFKTWCTFKKVDQLPTTSLSDDNQPEQ